MNARAGFPSLSFSLSLSHTFLLANWHLKLDLSAVIKNKTFIYELPFLRHATRSVGAGVGVSCLFPLSLALRFSPCLSSLSAFLISSIFHTRKRVVCPPILIDVLRVFLSEQLNKLIEEFLSLCLRFFLFVFVEFRVGGGGWFDVVLRHALWPTNCWHPFEFCSGFVKRLYDM